MESNTIIFRIENSAWDLHCLTGSVGRIGKFLGVHLLQVIGHFIGFPRKDFLLRACSVCIADLIKKSMG